MNKPKRKDRKAEVKGIASDVAIKKYKSFLESEFGAVDVSERGQYVSLHKRIKLGGKRSIDIIVYSTDTVYVSSSPYIDDSNFGELATNIIQLAQQATSPLELRRPISVQRARCILDFVHRLNLDNEYERMVAIVLSDTCNEIILREQMKALNIEGAPLDEGIPEKIRRIRNRGYSVPHEDSIKDLRETRNRIVHYGEIPHKEQAEGSLKIAENVLKSVSAK